MLKELTEWVELTDDNWTRRYGSDLTFMWQSEIRRTLSNLRMFSMNKHYDKPPLMIQ